jgi:hypothetical protein
MQLLASGGRPVRLESPRIEENTWKLMEDCWKSIPSERPTMVQIAALMKPTGRGRPVRLESPKIDENTRKRMDDCWKSISSERPTMAHIVMRLGIFQSLITDLNKVHCIAISRHRLHCD